MSFPVQKTITIELNGLDEDEIEFAMEEAIRKIKSGYTSGFDRNESSSFSFSIEEVSE